MVESRPTQVFISYAHADTARVSDFRRHFRPVERGNNLTAWFDRDLTAGQIWDEEIRRQINASDIFVCLVSAAFLDSNYIRDTELPAILQAARSRSALVVPIILEDCFWKQEFSEFQSLPKTGKADLRPVNKWRPKADGYHAAASQAEAAIRAWLETMPPPPSIYGAGVALLVTQNGFDLAPDAPAPAERNDPFQARLLTGLRDLWRDLYSDAGRSCGNSHPILMRNLERYGRLLDEPLAELDVVALATAGSALGGLVAAATSPQSGDLTEPLEPEIQSGFETLLREHARLIMGFAEGREMIARDGLIKRLLDDPPAAARALHDVLNPMIAAQGLLTERARALIESIDDSLIRRGDDRILVAGVISLDALANAVRQGGLSIVSIARAIGRKIGSLPNAVTYATFFALLAGDPNLDTYRAALLFLMDYSAQLLAFAAHHPELRRLIDWIMEQLDKRPKPTSNPLGDEGSGGGASPPHGFSIVEVRAMVLRGQAPPIAWVPWIQSIDIEGERSFSDLTPLTDLTALRELNCSRTSVSDLGPISSLRALETIDCSDTRIADLGPLFNLTNLKSVNISGSKVSDLGPLSNLENLQKIDCSGTKVSNLEPLSDLYSLETVCAADLSPIHGTRWLGGWRLKYLVLLGSHIDRPTGRWAKYQIDPAGAVHDPDSQASDSWFKRYVAVADARARMSQIMAEDSRE